MSTRADLADRTVSQSVAPEVVLQVDGLVKFYGRLCACGGVSLVLHQGEILGLLGENGAGKSTLAKALVGLVSVDGGTISLRGESVVVRDPVHASDLGIAMVHQHLSLIDSLRVWENVALSLPGRFSRSDICELVAKTGKEYGLEIDPLARVSRLTLGQRQRVEVVRALTREPAILIMDEPTSVLSGEESEELFRILRAAVSEHGRSVILISHHLSEVRYATDRVTVMRDGLVVLEAATADVDEHALARAMVGRDVVLQAERAAIGLLGTASQSTEPSEPSDVGGSEVSAPPVLRVRDLYARSERDAGSIEAMSLDVRQGEILGVAGVEGNGQAALCEVLGGLVQPASGTIEVDRTVLRASDCKAGAMLRAGIGIIPEDRHYSGCVLDMSIAENLMMADLESVTRWRLLVDRRALVARAEELAASFGVVTPSVTLPMRTLSGGMQQRVVLAREVSRAPKVLVASQPTRGLDVAAVEYMAEQFKQAAAKGIGILLVSSSLDEIIAISDRIVVIYAGRIVGQILPSEFDAERVGLLMGGRSE